MGSNDRGREGFDNNRLGYIDLGRISADTR